jgi:DNA replication and repair protein RecF
VSGANGAGKTNLLEALHVGTQGFSPRARSDAQLIRFGTDAGRVRVAGTRGDARFEADVVLSARDARRARFNGSGLRSAEQLRNELQTLVFTPDRLAVVKGGPAARRAYFDRSLGRLFPSRAQLPVDYAAAVGQRNAALRRVAAGHSSKAALAPWTETVAQLAETLIESRFELLELLSPSFESRCGQLDLAAATLVYDGDPPSVAELEAQLDRDLERGTTGLGPHLDDVRIEAAGRDLRNFGSQGEQRIAVLGLVLAEAGTLSERGTPPLVLLDDVLSELDEDRRRALGELLAAVTQALVTTTSAASLPTEPAQSLLVRPGEVVLA